MNMTSQKTNTVEPPLTDTSRRRTPLVSGHLSCSQLHTNTTFLTSHKRSPLLSGQFFWSQGCPFTGGSTVRTLLSGSYQVNEQCSICHCIFILDLSSEILGFLKKILHV